MTREIEGICFNEARNIICAAKLTADIADEAVALLNEFISEKVSKDEDWWDDFCHRVTEFVESVDA